MVSSLSNFSVTLRFSRFRFISLSNLLSKMSLTLKLVLQSSPSFPSAAGPWRNVRRLIVSPMTELRRWPVFWYRSRALSIRHLFLVFWRKHIDILAWIQGRYNNWTLYHHRCFYERQKIAKIAMNRIPNLGLVNLVCYLF